MIPYGNNAEAETIGRYIKDLEKLLKDKQEEITERNLELKEGVFMATADPRKTSCSASREARAALQDLRLSC